MSGLADALKAFGVTVHGAAPGEALRIEGPLRGANVSLDSAGSSQVLTGLLCALAYADADSELHIEHVVSRPYLHMTLEVLEDMGIVVEVLEDEGRSLRVRIPGKQRATAMDAAVDGDWSAAAFLMALDCSVRPSLECGRPRQRLHPGGRIHQGRVAAGGCRLAGTDEGVQVMAGQPKASKPI